jgi:hypothetical protein
VHCPSSVPYLLAVSFCILVHVLVPVTSRTCAHHMSLTSAQRVRAGRRVQRVRQAAVRGQQREPDLPAALPAVRGRHVR